ncbi:MAG: FAD-binding protein, partial [Acidobacteria bacterium]
MSRRSFLKLCSALATSGVLGSRFMWAYPDKLKNWAGNLEYGTDKVYSPKSVGQVREFVR